MAMSKEEILARIQAGAMNPNSPELSPEMVKQIQAQLANRDSQGWNMPIAPPKPDPEAAANAQIQNAAGNRPDQTAADPQQIIADHIKDMQKIQSAKSAIGQQPTPDQNAPQGSAPQQAALQQMIQARSGNPINPETGMPSFSKPAAQSPEDLQRQQDMAMKAEFLRRKSQGQ